MRRVPPPALVEHVDSVSLTEQSTTTINVGELLYGVFRRPSGGRAFLDRIETHVLSQLTVFPFEFRAAERYAVVRAELERLGEPIGDADMRIGAIALVTGCVTVTANGRHFRRIPGLVIENWLER